MSVEFLFDGPADAATTVLLAHGAGAPMDGPSMSLAAGALAAAGLRVARFEFAYMAARRSGKGRPPPRGETLIPEYVAAVEALGAAGQLVIGGKSLGGRVASMAVDELHAAGKVAGLLCLGYPFHPPGRPEKLRIAHLHDMRAQALICQGTRDVFGRRDEVESYPLSERIEILWLEDGDHDLKPRKKLSGFTHADHMRTMAEAVAAWTGRIAPG